MWTAFLSVSIAKERAACVLNESGLRSSNEGRAEVRIKTDYLNAKILSHRANLQRYAMLLATQLTELERKSLHKRIAEEHAEVVRVELLREAKAAKPKKGRSPYRPQSSSASRRTAGASGFLNLSQSGER